MSEAGDIDEVQLDADQVAERLRQPAIARVLARLLLRHARDHLTSAPTSLPARK